MRIRTLLMTASVAALGVAGAASAQDNALVIQQLGDQGFASASQTGARNESLIIQGDGTVANGASVPLIGNNNDMLVIQETNRNFAEAAMGSGGNRNRIAILQTVGARNVTLGPNASGGSGGQGDDNSFASVQTGADNVVNGGGFRPAHSLPPGTGQVTDISALGDINGGLIPTDLPGGSIGGSGHAVFAGSNNFTALGQIGSNNRFGVMTVGNNNSIIGSGQGTLAQVDMNQEASDRGATGSFFDNGLSDATINSGDSSAAFGSGLATQEGNDNVAHLTQQGDANTIAFNQLSSNNSAQIYQQGNLNGALAVQN